jgi:hypothetical protein
VALMMLQTRVENGGFEAETEIYTKQGFSFRGDKEENRCITSKQRDEDSNASTEATISVCSGR